MTETHEFQPLHIAVLTAFDSGTEPTDKSNKPPAERRIVRDYRYAIRTVVP